MATATAADAVSVHPVSEAIGAEIRDVELACLEDGAFAAIERAWLAHQVLLFRGQALSTEQLLAFAARFGALENAPLNVTGKPWIPHFPQLAVMSNVRENDRPIGSLGAGEASWHTDMSYRADPPSASVLYAVEVPASGGGNTGFADMYAAYENLPAALAARVEQLVIVHDSSRNSADEQRPGIAVVGDPRQAPGARHPAVRTHPLTGRRALFLGRRRNAWIVDLDLEHSEALLDELWAHATRPEFTWHHRWRVGDLLVWDNRCVMHRRDAFDAAQRRVMHRAQVAGDRPFL
jgi:taurine dioxygenase